MNWTALFHLAVSSNVFTAANISEEMMGTLSREDLRDLFPGPENFFRRKAVWRVCHVEVSDMALTNHLCKLPEAHSEQHSQCFWNGHGSLQVCSIQFLSVKFILLLFLLH